MTDQPTTCGAGLAWHSPLPAKLGELTAATAAVLEVHMKALDLTDEHARQEHDAYRKLAADHRTIAAQLQATGAAMADYRNLPMGRHDLQVMSSQEAVDAFARFVTVEEELLALLQTRLTQDRQMIGMMSGAGAGGNP